jgi:hypothetical protein
MNSTFTVSDGAKENEAPSQKPAAAVPAPASAKPAPGPVTPPVQPPTSSYDITPHRLELPPEPLHDPDNYNINDLKSDEDTDDDEQPRKEIPQWAAGKRAGTHIHLKPRQSFRLRLPCRGGRTGPSSDVTLQ